jgi:hypothetical protein
MQSSPVPQMRCSPRDTTKAEIAMRLTISRRLIGRLARMAAT